MDQVVKYDVRPPLPVEIENVLVNGNLASLQPQQRIFYYQTLCESLGLNPATRPFEYITLNNKLVLYARKDATEQLRKIHSISIGQLETEFVGDLYVVTAHAHTPEGRSDVDMGCVRVGNLSGDALANAIMKAVTKAKRRVTLSICGLGFLDETEIETIPNASKCEVDLDRISVEQKGKIIELENLAKSLYGDQSIIKFREIVSAIGRNRDIRADINSIYDLSTEEMDFVISEMQKRVNGEVV